MLNSVSPLGFETVRCLEAAGWVLFEDIISEISIPPLDNSAMDGYAVRCQDTVGASVKNSVILDVSGEVKAGGEFKSKQVTENRAIRIMTGAPIPEGADSVIPVEDTEEKNERVSIAKELKRYENIRFAGEDIRKGQTVLKRGDCLKSADVGLLASLNYMDVKVFKRPEVAILSTGDEVVDVGDKISPGQIRNSNAYTLYSEVKKYNAIPQYIGIAKDSKEDTKEKFIKAFEYDIIITTGGVSLGKYDFVKDVMKDLDVEIKIENIRMKPGKPLVFGTKGNKLFFGLPGNPVSTMISFIQFVRPAILKLAGASRVKKPEMSAILDNEIRKKPDRKHYIRGFFTIRKGDLHVSATGPQGSGILRSMSEANCLIIIPEGVEIARAGEMVTVQMIGHEEIF